MSTVIETILDQYIESTFTDYVGLYKCYGCLELRALEGHSIDVLDEYLQSDWISDRVETYKAYTFPEKGNFIYIQKTKFNTTTLFVYLDGSERSRTVFDLSFVDSAAIAIIEAIISEFS